MGDRGLDAAVKQPVNTDNRRLMHCVFFIAEENGRLMRSVRNAIVIGFAIIFGVGEAGAVEFDSILRWRNIGPYRGGRTRAIAGVPSQPNVFYVAPALALPALTSTSSGLKTKASKTAPTFPIPTSSLRKSSKTWKLLSRNSLQLLRT